MRKAPVLLIVDACAERARRLSVAISSFLVCEIAIALNGMDGAAAAIALRPRAAVVDIGAGFDAVGLAASIQEQMDGRAPALIAMADESDLMRVAQAGVFQHALAKPVEERRLAALLMSL